jgi:predicted alpha/beta-hydrolase family hydrolase
MPEPQVKPLRIALNDDTSVSALLVTPPKAAACYVFAHGAGAGMTHAFMAATVTQLAARGIATLRYQFTYMEKGSKRPDAPKVAHAAVRTAVAQARKQLPGLPLIAGGKSFGGRMTSQAQALTRLEGVVGLAFLGFPLHPANKPSRERAAHLADVNIPMLFLQGTRDALADLAELNPVIASLGKRATLTLLDDADHSLNVPARTGRKDADVLGEALDSFAAWVARIA